MASTSSSERTLKIIVEYDGTGLCGWQRQNSGPTVQQHLEEAITTMTHRPTLLFGASRTDAGVHSLGQTAIFKTESNIPCLGFRQGINRVLPNSICLRSVDEVPAGFHPRFDAIGKHYRYTILNRSVRSPLQRYYSWHQPKSLDVPAMHNSAQILRGEHDFSSFRASGCGAHTPNREIYKTTVHRDGDHVLIDIWGNAFLRNMVRIIAGTLVDTGRGATKPSQLIEILQGADRRLAGATAPPQGLCLEEIYFDRDRLARSLES